MHGLTTKLRSLESICLFGHLANQGFFVNTAGLERLLRDGKAGWMMGASNEVLRQIVGKTSLFGLGAVDFW